MEKFYQRLKRIRVEKNKSVKQMYTALNISPSTYRDWEYGRLIKGEPYVEMARILDISIEELMTGKSPNPDLVKKRIEKCEEAFKKTDNELRYEGHIQHFGPIYYEVEIIELDKEAEVNDFEKRE